MDKNTRFVIIGGGAAGIAAANRLWKKGYTKTIVLEKQAEIGGKCKTIIADGLSLDIGAVYVLANYQTIARLARETKSHLRKSFAFEHVGADGTYRPFGFPQPSLVSKISEYARLGAEIIKNYQALYLSLGEWNSSTAQNLAEPASSWMEKHRLDYFQKSAYALLKVFGFGYETQQIPVGYMINIFTKLARNGNLLSLWDVPSVSLYHIEEGYGEVLKRMAAPLNVQLGVHIDRIERNSTNGGLVHSNQGVFEFDKLVIACPLPPILNLIDASPDETDLFSKIKSFNIWQVTAKADNLHNALIIDENLENANIGNTMILFRYRDNANWYYFCGYERLDSPQTDQDILQSVQETVEKLNGYMIGDLQLRRWAGYLPHYQPREFALGYHQRLNALQGLNSTYYTGEIFANIGVESVTRFSEQMIEKYFG